MLNLIISLVLVLLLGGTAKATDITSSLPVAVTTGSVTAFQGAGYTVTPGTGTWTVVLTSGAYATPLYTLSTNTVVSTGSITVFPASGIPLYVLSTGTFVSSDTLQDQSVVASTSGVIGTVSLGTSFAKT